MLVDLLFAVGALLLVLWLRDGRSWRLAASPSCFAGATLTKREGLLFAALALGVAFAASWSAQAVGVAGARPSVTAVVVAAAIPWRLWYRSHDITGEAPPSLGVGGVARPRARLAAAVGGRAVRHHRSGRSSRSSSCSRSAAALVWGDRASRGLRRRAPGARLPRGGVGHVLLFAADHRRRAVNPIVRYTGAIVLLAAVVDAVARSHPPGATLREKP